MLLRSRCLKGQGVDTSLESNDFGSPSKSSPNSSTKRKRGRPPGSKNKPKCTCSNTINQQNDSSCTLNINLPHQLTPFLSLSFNGEKFTCCQSELRSETCNKSHTGISCSSQSLSSSSTNTTCDVGIQVDLNIGNIAGSMLTARPMEDSIVGSLSPILHLTDSIGECSPLACGGGKNIKECSKNLNDLNLTTSLQVNECDSEPESMSDAQSKNLNRKSRGKPTPNKINSKELDRESEDDGVGQQVLKSKKTRNITPRKKVSCQTSKLQSSRGKPETASSPGASSPGKRSGSALTESSDNDDLFTLARSLSNPKKQRMSSIYSSMSDSSFGSPKKTCRKEPEVEEMAKRNGRVERTPVSETDSDNEFVIALPSPKTKGVGTVTGKKPSDESPLKLQKVDPKKVLVVSDEESAGIESSEDSVGYDSEPSKKKPSPQSKVEQKLSNALRTPEKTVVSSDEDNEIVAVEEIELASDIEEEKLSERGGEEVRSGSAPPKETDKDVSESDSEQMESKPVNSPQKHSNSFPSESDSDCEVEDKELRIRGKKTKNNSAKEVEEQQEDMRVSEAESSSEDRDQSEQEEVAAVTSQNGKVSRADSALQSSPVVWKPSKRQRRKQQDSDEESDEETPPPPASKPSVWQVTKRSKEKSSRVDFIPLDTGTKTAFRVAPLGSTRSQHPAADFKARMLYGGRVKRTTTKALLTDRAKQQAGDRCRTK